jgi:hypothetical protein
MDFSGRRERQRAVRLNLAVDRNFAAGELRHEVAAAIVG